METVFAKLLCLPREGRLVNLLPPRGARRGVPHRGRGGAAVGLRGSLGGMSLKRENPCSVQTAPQTIPTGCQCLVKAESLAC